MEESPTLIPPPLTIKPPQLKEEYYCIFYQRRHLMMLNGEQEFDSSKTEVEAKYQQLYSRCQKNACEAQSSENNHRMINITLYQYCNRCGHWILKSQASIHRDVHAAIVLPNLLLGDRFCSMSKKELIDRQKVTHIVNAASQLSNYLQKQGIQYLKLGLEDTLGEKMIVQAEKGAEFIKKAHDKGGKVFVHCAMGKSRSVSVIVMYLMNYKNMSLEEALNLVKNVRPMAKPNSSYMQQLRQYEEHQILGKSD